MNFVVQTCGCLCEVETNFWKNIVRTSKFVLLIKIAIVQISYVVVVIYFEVYCNLDISYAIIPQRLL